MEHPEDLHERVLRSDENVWVQKPYPNKQNENERHKRIHTIKLKASSKEEKSIMYLINGPVIIHGFDIGEIARSLPLDFGFRSVCLAELRKSTE